jgi:Na+/H+ antiporter NhaD/arsenite permease-like protein
MSHSVETPNERPVLTAIAIIILAYFAWMIFSPSARIAQPHGGHPPAEQEHTNAAQTDGLHADEPAHPTAAHAGDETHAEKPHADGHGSVPPFWAVIPFVFLLMAIALFPLLSATEHWWESNLHRFYVAAGLAAVTLLYYLYASGAGRVGTVLSHAILLEYIPFIVLLFSLYTISGGIRIEGDLIATPRVNCIFLIVGGLLASFVGTTGAAMLLIRPLIDTNNERKYNQHTVVFFIFMVCNCGGCLLPIGDPPLFLGYLKGVAFLWTMENLIVPWAVACTMLVATYYVVDRFWYYPKESEFAKRLDIAKERPLSISGLNPNAWLLLGVVLSVALLDPTKILPGTNWHPWPFLREIMQLGLVGLSLWLGTKKIRQENRFNYHAILEVAALFIGIFICMQPALEILHEQGANLGLSSPMAFFWATGGLSAVLDNAPTYVVFYETAASDPRFAGHAFHELVSMPGEPAEQARHILVGISLGAVFLGAMTYIGNGPNFMVRAIAEQSGIRMPSFFGYILRYAIPFLVPIFFIVSQLFL